MTVRQWVESRTSQAPESLTRRMMSVLGRDARRDESETPDACLRGAARALETLIADARFGRESALELLAIDALVTQAFEYVSAHAPSRIEQVASESAHVLAPLTTARV